MALDWLELLQRRLQRRVERLEATDNLGHHNVLRQFCAFLTGQPVFATVLEELEQRFPEMANAARARVDCSDEPATIAYTWFLIRQCAEDDKSPEITIASSHFARDRKPQGGWTQPTYRDKLNIFHTLYIRPLADYLEEHLDSQQVTLALIHRYRQKCEWFQREHVRGFVEADTSRGEKKLQAHLYEYLHDQGLQFYIEPTSASGKPDMVADQKRGERLIAEVKIFDTDRSKGVPYLARGFHQAYQYLVDYGVPIGYLVIYNTCGTPLRFSLQDQSGTTPHIVYNNKVVFLLVIDVSDHPAPASKRGALKPVVLESDLIPPSC